ncbi:MAG: ABC transporter permease [Candidatus Aquicultorales bacterium]
MVLVTGLKELYAYRGLLHTMVKREIKVRYKQSVLGMAWALLQPISMTLIFTAVFSIIARFPSEGIPYPLFFLAGFVPWSFVNSAINASSASIVSNRSLVTKIFLPREIFPIAATSASFVDFMVGALALSALISYYNVSLTVNALYFLPIIVVQIILALAIGLFVSSLNVFYRDVRSIVALTLQTWMYASPVVYPVSRVPERIRDFYVLNPMAGIIDGYRNCLLKGIPPAWKPLLASAVISLVMFVVAYIAFKRAARNFADVI